MKKLKLALIAVIIAAGTFGVFAFSNATEPTVETDISTTTLETTEVTDASTTTLHWFDAVSGAYLGPKTLAEQQQECGDPGDIDCAYGYSTNPPSGSRITVTKEE